MSECVYCGCTDKCACPGGCFWVDRYKTICSSCAIRKGIIFENKITGKKVKIISAKYNPVGMSAKLQVEALPGYDYYKTELDFFDFLYNYKHD